MSIYKKYSTDKTKDQEGVFIPVGGGASFKLTRMGPTNIRYGNKFKALSKPYERLAKNDELSPEKALEIQVKAFCGTVLVDWKDVTDKDGNPLEFSEENAVKVLTDLPDLYLELVSESENRDNFQIDEKEAEDIGKK